jgi:hypothetical protein
LITVTRAADVDATAATAAARTGCQQYNTKRRQKKEPVFSDHSLILAFYRKKSNNINMDPGQIVFMYSRLILGALAAFFAIMLWSRTRDPAWMFVIIGTMTLYVEVIYSILELLGITTGYVLFLGTVSIVTILLPTLYMLFFIIALLIMVAGRHRHKYKT